MHKILKSYLKKLTNLTTSNRSLLLLRLSEEQDLDLNLLDFVKGKSSFHFIDQLISGKKEISICPLADSRNESVNRVSEKIKKIERRENFLFEERGSKDLYVGWPFVRGKFSDGTLVRCPLLFFPVTIELKENNWVLQPREDVPAGFNKSFLLAYAHYNGISLSDELQETTLEDFSSDAQIFRTELYKILKDSPLEINFNQDLFVDKLLSFENFKKEDFEEKHGQGELKLFSEAVLGIFPQAGSYLVPDYDYLIKNNSLPDLEEFFYQRSGKAKENVPPYQSPAAVKEEQTITPFPIDAAQENAIIAVKKGKSLVVQGPPGTGKSQLISNLICDFISRGKNVLLVCQKRAALDVVYDRLKKKDIQNFIGLVHDYKNDRKQIYDQINSQIEKLDEYKFKNNSLDAIYLERTFVQASRRIEQLSDELEEFRKALFDERECGISVKELYLSCRQDGPSIDVKQEFRYFKIEEINHFVRQLKRLIPYAIRFEKKDYLWNDRVSFADFSVSDKKAMNDVLERIPFFQANLSDGISEILGANLELEEIEWLLDRRDQITQFLQFLEDKVAYSNFVYFLNKNTDQDWLIIQEKQISECFKGSGIENTLPTEQLGPFLKVLENAKSARKGLFSWLKWSWFSKEKYLLKRVMVANKLRWRKDAIEEITQKVDNRMNLEHNLTELKQCGWLQNVPEERDFTILSDWFHHQQTAIAAKNIIKDLRSLKGFLHFPTLTYPELKQKLNSLLKILSTLPSEKKRWLKLLTPRQVSRILGAFDYSIDLAKVLEKDFESLVEYDKIKDKGLIYEKEVYEKLLKDGSNLDTEEVVQLFENSIKLAWIDFIESKYPILRSVSSLKMEQMEKELQECVEQKEALSAEILLMKIRERTYENVEYNRLENMVTYRDLKHQVTKKKKIWPLRKLISAHSSELFQLVPCWFASPESVSSIFPIETEFDLVIFDEASQCYAENGIPSIYRGKQVVITGDSKQLQPSDLYTVRWEEEEEVPELEIDSLLDLGKSYLPEFSLIGHYRSHSLDLIEFSNNHFYQNKLKVLPHYSDVNKGEPSIKFINVNGVWEKNSNAKEAEEIVKLIGELKKKDPNKSIGVVTFNYKQQMLIQDFVEERYKKMDPEYFFVKNIENVQGDERDIIIFSLGYAPNASSKLIMNFGSLNAEKGENRLNVAITRAREKIYVISSILPEQMDISSVKNEGPKLLKKYLEYVRDVSEKKFKPLYPPFEKRRNEWYLKNELMQTELPFKTFTELPFTDLTIKKDSNYLGLIHTDDELYYQALTAKEAHAYIPLSLQKKQWRYKRVFSRMYWENKESVKETLIKIFRNHDKA